jgi:ring-1,2-phenylacetyl-CoA epoxidase subunit PaaC
MIRLGDGTEESHTRMQNAVNDLWMFAGEAMIASDVDKAILQTGIGVDVEAIKPLWDEQVNNILAEAQLKRPADIWMQRGGKNGTHTEHLGYILAELQFMQRAYPGMEW